MDKNIKEKIDPKDYIEIKIPIKNNSKNNSNSDSFTFKTINEINNNFDIINTIKLTKDLDYVKREFPLMYNIFQICNFFNINYNNEEEFSIRQKIEIFTEGSHDFEKPKNLSTNYKMKDCKCILCKSNFKAIRNTIKICNSKHYCYAFDILTGERFKKEIKKWNKVYYDEINCFDGNHNDNNCNNDDCDDVNYNKVKTCFCYLEGKCLPIKSHQVSVNNIITIYEGTNKVKNFTTEDRKNIVKNQIENDNFGLTTKNKDGSINEKRYKEHSKNSKDLAMKRTSNGTHNFYFITKEEKIKIANKTAKKRNKNGSYKKFSGPGECFICHNIVEYRDVTRICPKCRANLAKDIKTLKH